MVHRLVGVSEVNGTDHLGQDMTLENHTNVVLLRNAGNQDVKAKNCTIRSETSRQEDYQDLEILY